MTPSVPQSASLAGATADAVETDPGQRLLESHGSGTSGGGARRTRVLLGLLLVALLVVPAVGTAVWSAAQPSTYAAEVDLLHAPSDTSATDTIDRQLATQRVLLLRRDGLDDAAATVGRDADELADNTGVEIVEGSSLLRIRVVDEDRDRAERAAALVAGQHVRVVDRLAPASNIGRVEAVAPSTGRVEKVGPQPLRAAAAGALLGLVLLLAFVALLRLRGRPSRHSRM